MANVSVEELLDAGVHFGHLTQKWNPKMAPYIFMEQNGIHIIDLNKTKAKLDEAAEAVKNIVKGGRRILFVATKKQAKDIVMQEADRVKMPYVTERWLGGMLTNFATVRKSIKKLQNLDKMADDGTYANINKKERLMIEREKVKLRRLLGGITEMPKIPAALFVVDVKREHIAVAEAHKLNIPVFAIVDTNADPNKVDFAIPGNDDSAKSIALITRVLTDAIIQGIQERRREREEQEEETAATATATQAATETEEVTAE